MIKIGCVVKNTLRSKPTTTSKEKLEGATFDHEGCLEHQTRTNKRTIMIAANSGGPRVTIMACVHKNTSRSKTITITCVDENTSRSRTTTTTTNEKLKRTTCDLDCSAGKKSGGKRTKKKKNDGHQHDNERGKLEGATCDQDCFVEDKRHGRAKRRLRPTHKPEGATCDHDGGVENNTPMTTVLSH